MVQFPITTGQALVCIRDMVDSFITEHDMAWDKFRKDYESEHGFSVGRPLSLQSYIGSDLTIDMAYLALKAERGVPFTDEYWIRSQGMQHIASEEDREANDRVWGDVVAKFSVTFDGTNFTDIHWVEDGKCRIKNTLLRDGELYKRY